MISTDWIHHNAHNTSDAGYGLGFGRRAAAATIDDRAGVHRQH